jgi:hypothetical protein
MAKTTPMTHQGSSSPPPASRPPRKNPYRDGASLCHQHYDLYEMIRHPQASKQNRPPLPPTKGKSKQQLLEQDIQSAFKKNNHQIQGFGYFIIGRFLKLIFFLIILPLYISFYALPRWLFRHAVLKPLLKASHWLRSVFSKLLNIAKSAWKIAAAPVFFILKFRSLYKEKRPMTPGSFFSFLKQGILFFFKFSFTFLKLSIFFLHRFAKMSHSLFMRFYKPLAAIVRTVRDLPLQIKKQCKRRIEEWKSKILNLLKKAIFKYFHGFFSLFNWIKKMSGLLVKGISNTRKKLSFNPRETAISINKRAYKACQKFMDLLEKKMTIVSHSIKSFLSKLMKPFRYIANVYKKIPFPSFSLKRPKALWTEIRQTIFKANSYRKECSEIITKGIENLMIPLISLIKRYCRKSLVLLLKQRSRLTITAEYFKSWILCKTLKHAPSKTELKQLLASSMVKLKSPLVISQKVVEPALVALKQKKDGLIFKIRVFIGCTKVLFYHEMARISQLTYSMGL